MRGHREQVAEEVRHEVREEKPEDTDSVASDPHGRERWPANGRETGCGEPRRRPPGVTTDHLRPGVLFDVDGTLCDTNYLHTLAWSRALRESGEWAPMNAIHRLIGMGGEQLVPELLGHDSPEATAAAPAVPGARRGCPCLPPGG